jgi:hypothetical protein
MTDSAGLERRYRRLLAWYPRSFRGDREEEVLAVLMASASPGRRWPRLAETVDVLKSALWMRLRSVGSWSENQRWAEALALFSVAAPLLLLVTYGLEVAIPYQLPQAGETGFPLAARAIAQHPQAGGLSLLTMPGFDVALGWQVIIAVLVLLGLRWIALAGIAGSACCWCFMAYRDAGILVLSRPLVLLTGGAYILAAAALIASPGPRRGRHLMNWGHGVVLLLVASAVQVSTLMYDATRGLAGFPATHAGSADAAAFLVISIVLGIAAAALMVVLKMNRYFPLLLLAILYPYVMELAVTPASSGGDLIGSPTPFHLAVLFLPPLLFACAAIHFTLTPRRPRVLA